MIKLPEINERLRNLYERVKILLKDEKSVGKATYGDLIRLVHDYEEIINALDDSKYCFADFETVYLLCAIGTWWEETLEKTHKGQLDKKRGVGDIAETVRPFGPLMDCFQANPTVIMGVTDLEVKTDFGRKVREYLCHDFYLRMIALHKENKKEQTRLAEFRKDEEFTEWAKKIRDNKSEEKYIEDLKKGLECLRWSMVKIDRDLWIGTIWKWNKLQRWARKWLWPW